MENELKTDPADLIEQDPVLHMLGVLIGAKSKWLGTASALLDQLIIIGAETKSVMPNDPRWPKNAAQLSHHLRTARPLLDEMGIVYEFDRKEWKRLHILYEAKAFPAAAKAHFAKRAEADRAREQAAQAAAAQTLAQADAGGTRRDAASTAQAGAEASGAASCTTASGTSGCAAADAACPPSKASRAAVPVTASANGNGDRSTNAAQEDLSQLAGPGTRRDAASTAQAGAVSSGAASFTTASSTTGCATADAARSIRRGDRQSATGAGERGD